jgi:hypothetical protein
MLLIPLHSFAAQGEAFAFEEMFNIAHEVAHVEGASHHHDEHGTPHYDNSGESAKHFAEHSASNAYMALPSAAIAFPVTETVKVARSDLGQFIPDPILERPQRPPQSSLG